MSSKLLSGDYPFMNAACSVAKTLDDVKALASTSVAAVLVGSITPLERAGNEEPRWYQGDTFALNAFGMPNGGVEFYNKALPEMVKLVHEADKKFVLSIAGFSKDDYVVLARLGHSHGVDVLELNFGCPNVSVDGTQKPIVSFDIEALRENIRAVAGVAPGTPIAVKLSPYSNPAELKEVAATLSGLPIAAVVTMNTMPNAYWIDVDGPVIKPNSGLAGLSGESILPIALGQVQMMRAALPDTIEVWGVGGVSSAKTAKMMFDSGASVVQAATLIISNGHASIDILEQTA